MIVGSLLLILVAVALLALGLANGSSVLLVSSIVASLLAAVALVVGARQAAAARIGAGDGEAYPRAGGEGDGDGDVHPRPAGPAVPSQGGFRADRYDPIDVDDSGRRQPADMSAASEGSAPDRVDDEVPADEPAPEYSTPADAARVAQLADDVLVVDGRPRYHLPGCPHLRDRDTEPLPVSEAVELGFTPCGGCRPDQALLAGSRHG